MRDVLFPIACIAVMSASVSWCITYLSCVTVQEDAAPSPPTCLELRGPATDNAEHLWSAHCMSNDYTPSHCIESACIAFRGKP